MQHICTLDCKCKLDLCKAAAGLAEASRMLSASMMSDSNDLIQDYLAFFKVERARTEGALGAYRDHLIKA
jgi:hypothetical protein